MSMFVMFSARRAPPPTFVACGGGGGGARVPIVDVGPRPPPPLLRSFSPALRGGCVPAGARGGGRAIETIRLRLRGGMRGAQRRCSGGHEIAHPRGQGREDLRNNLLRERRERSCRHHLVLPGRKLRRHTVLLPHVEAAALRAQPVGEELVVPDSVSGCAPAEYVLRPTQYLRSTLLEIFSGTKPPRLTARGLQGQER